MVVQKDPETPEALLIRAKTDALRLISFKPRSVEELRSRLREKHHGDALIAEVIEAFKRQGLLDDEKYARLYANSRIHERPAGKRQLELELKKKGLAAPVVAKTMESLSDYDEKKAARDLVEGRFRRMAGLPDEKKRNRLFGFLKRRGFSNDVIFGVLNGLFKDAKDENF